MRVCPTGFGANFAVVFVSIYWLREFLFSAVTGRFDFRCQLKELLLLYYKICPCSSDVNLAMIINMMANQSLLTLSSIVDLNTGTSFVNIDALIIDISTW